jgi:predicted nuclease with RNAse H fold
MLRIDNDGARGGARVLRLDGKVIGRWVGELRRCCEEVLLVPGQHLALDLRGVTFIDANGVALFRELTERGVALTNCSPFAAEQLRSSVEMPSNN